MKCRINWICVISALLNAILIIAFFQMKAPKMEKIHILQAPLLIGSAKDNNYYLLPKDTYLYFDSAFPEGFTRYRIYVNIKDQLPLQDNKQQIEAPISADVITKSRLLNLLENVKLDKDDIKSILSNGRFNEADKKEIQEFLQNHSSR